MSRYRGRHRAGLLPVVPLDRWIDPALVAAAWSSVAYNAALRAGLAARRDAAVRLYGPL